MQDVSGYGLQVHVLASITFPAGFTVTQFADDADPFDAPNIQIADKAMGLNGDLLVWRKPAPIIITLNVVPNTPDDRNLSFLAEANRVGRGKLTLPQDIVTLTGIYPDGGRRVYTQGLITDFMPGHPVASAGRLKSKPYSFAFENVLGV